MPSNLNALIRYKQIDKCLRNKYVDCTIERMREKCSEQLGEYRGVYKKVSERTIRDDIKTMRGDSLGFNAPIVVSKGVYSYSEEDFSIFNSSIDDMELLKDIMLMLLEEKDNISSSNLESILNVLSVKTGISLPSRKEGIMEIHSEEILFNESLDNNFIMNVSEDIKSNKLELFNISSVSEKKEISALYSWEAIFNLFK